MGYSLWHISLSAITPKFFSGSSDFYQKLIKIPAWSRRSGTFPCLLQLFRRMRNSAEAKGCENGRQGFHGPSQDHEDQALIPFLPCMHGKVGRRMGLSLFGEGSHAFSKHWSPALWVPPCRGADHPLPRSARGLRRRRRRWR